MELPLLSHIGNIHNLLMEDIHYPSYLNDLDDRMYIFIDQIVNSVANIISIISEKILNGYTYDLDYNILDIINNEVQITFDMEKNAVPCYSNDFMCRSSNITISRNTKIDLSFINLKNIKKADFVYIFLALILGAVESLFQTLTPIEYTGCNKSEHKDIFNDLFDVYLKSSYTDEEYNDYEELYDYYYLREMDNEKIEFIQHFVDITTDKNRKIKQLDKIVYNLINDKLYDDKIRQDIKN